MSQDNDLTALVTRGFEGLDTQLRERDVKVAQLSEKVVVVELKIDQLKETLANKGETDKIASRVDQLEKAALKTEQKQAENAKWIKGLVGSVILLLLGFVFNFIRITVK